MRFVRRIYYDKLTGEVLDSHMAQGDIVVLPVSEELAILPELAGRTETDTGVLEWLTPDPEVEAMAAVKMPVVDVSGGVPVLGWADWPEPEPAPEYDELADAVEALGVLGVEEVQ